MESANATLTQRIANGLITRLSAAREDDPVRLRPTLARAAAIALVATLVGGPSFAGTASISIDSVGGKRIAAGEVRGSLSGKVLVQGAAVPANAAPAPAPVAKPLVADAGDSVFSATNAWATLLGAGFGGVEPYPFAWTATAGTIDGANAPTAQLRTGGVSPGTYDVSLVVTDSTGATASDKKKAVIYAPVQATFLDETRSDVLPGVDPLGLVPLSFNFDVPVNTASFHVHVSWDVSLNDYDLNVLDPNGSRIKRSAHDAGVPEDVDIDSPVAGTWTAELEKFTTVGDNPRVVVSALVPPADPRPAVRAGGPYKFAIGAAQAIAGTVTGAAPLTLGWDSDQDGRIDRTGTAFTGSFGEGMRLITLRATDANGLRRRETTSVLVATPARLAAATTAITVVGINDSGLNPYHLEFSADTYPDPDVLALTNNFRRHPSDYIPGYPKDTPAIRMTLGKGYFPAEDADLWSLKDAAHPYGLEFGKLYWIPGTKIIGATQPGPLSCSNCATGAHVILDDDGHGSGSSSVSVGNRYGYCPTCLIVIEKGLNADPAAALPWVDIQSNSWGPLANVPLDLPTQLSGGDPGRTTRLAVERGQTVLFASGNGAANAFDVPISTYGTSNTGPDWNVVVGAIRRDNQRAIVGDGTPAHLSSWGDGNLPSACGTGTVSQCAFGGTSAATPYTAGVFGNVLTQVRRSIGDNNVGQRPGQVVAQGTPTGTTYLADGKLTRAELREAVLKTAFPLNQDNAQSIPILPYPLTAPYQGDINVVFEGYGAATPNSAKRAIDVLLGKMPLPNREAEDRWFAIDRQIRDSIWGGYDRNGDGTKDSEAALGSFGIGLADVQSANATLAVIAKITNTMAALSSRQTTGPNALAYWLHRGSEGEPGVAPGCGDGVTYMDQTNSAGDFDPCFENRATTVLAAYRPVGIWPTTADSTVALPSGSSVQVELYLATDQATIIRPTGVLMAGDRVLGTGAGTPTPTIGSGPWVSQGFPVNPQIISPAIPAGVKIDQNKCKELGELCWNKLVWSFTTTRPAIPGEQLTFQVQLIGTRAWSFGYEAQHSSKIVIVPASTAGSSLDFNTTVDDPAEGAKLAEGAFNVYGTATFPNLGTTPAGDHPTIKRVDVSVDDGTFANPIQANLDESSGAWWAPIPRLAVGAHTLYARASLDRNSSPVTTRHITVLDTQTSPRVQWQVTTRGAAPSVTGWQQASGVLSYVFQFDTRTYGKGDFTIYTRLVEQGAPTASTSVNAKFR
jgi:hypothetical protein